MEGGRPDILIEEASGWPIAIEAERSNHASAEADAQARLGRTVANTGRQIETAIALVYPANLHSLDGSALRYAISSTQDLEYALYTRRVDSPPERLPSQGWITGSVRDLAMLVHRAAVPPPRVAALAFELEDGVRLAAEEFTRRHPYGNELGTRVASVLGQSDDEEGQTRRMAMTVIVNALVFHESLAEVEFKVPGLEAGSSRGVRPIESFRPGGMFAPGEVCLEWERILTINYWPIFWSAKEMLRLMPTATANALLGWLWQTGQKLVAGGVTRSHDLMGIVFQRLIADRKFLATYYTRPEAAALLATLALPAHRPLGGADWGEGETLAGAQIGDFACGTGTLLSMAYQRMSLLHELHGGDSRRLHGPMMRHGLVGLDVLNIAVHLTAAMLAGSQPDTPFDGECLLTMPYGKQEDGNVAIGSLDLLAETVQPSLMDTAAAVSAGGRAPERVRDLVSRVGHTQFDLVIMNPPFVRSTGMEAEKRGTGNPAFAAFDTDKATQRRMQDSLAVLRGTASIGTGNAGLAADFLDLALRKVRRDGVIALVLPLSAASGTEWEEARKAVAKHCQDVIVVTVAGVGTYPMLWAHAAKRERLLVVYPDSEGRIKAASGKVTQNDLMEKAASVWGTASRAHYNRDLRFNSQSLIVAMTDRPCIGGRAWPSVILENKEHEYAFALWSNSTLGLLLHWWVANKTQSGRGTNTVTSIQQIPTLDVRVLTDGQMASAKTAFEALRERRFLPFDQIDEDPARTELDRRLLVDVLCLPQELCEADGPIDLLRRKLAREPQIHGGKQTRVVFYAKGDENNEPRSDR